VNSGKRLFAALIIQQVWEYSKLSAIFSGAICNVSGAICTLPREALTEYVLERYFPEVNVHDENGIAYGNLRVAICILLLKLSCSLFLHKLSLS